MSDAAPLPILALHTTEGEGSLAVAKGDRVISVTFEAGGQHAPVLLGEVLRLLERAGLGISELRALAVTTGPGSFTGIRVGLATAQGLGAARRVQVWACDSLRASAAAVGRLESPLAVVLDARRGEVYAAVYDVQGDVPQARIEPFCAPPEVAAAEFMALVSAPVPGRPRGSAATELVLVGSGAGLVCPHLNGIAIEERGAAAVPVAEALLGLARVGGCRRVEPQELEPTYLRKSDAEVRRDGFLRSSAEPSA